MGNPYGFKAVSGPGGNAGPAGEDDPRPLTHDPEAAGGIAMPMSQEYGCDAVRWDVDRAEQFTDGRSRVDQHPAVYHNCGGKTAVADVPRTALRAIVDSALGPCGSERASISAPSVVATGDGDRAAASQEDDVHECRISSPSPLSLWGLRWERHRIPRDASARIRPRPDP